MERDLDELVKVVCSDVARDSCSIEMNFYSCFDEIVISRNDKCTTAQEQQQTNGLER